MFHIYLFCALAGLIGTNGLPYFVKGLMGGKLAMPFGLSASTISSVVWGWVNLVVAGILFYYSHYHQHLLRSFAAVAVASLVMALVLANLMPQQTAKK